MKKLFFLFFLLFLTSELFAKDFLVGLVIPSQDNPAPYQQMIQSYGGRTLVFHSQAPLQELDKKLPLLSALIFAGERDAQMKTTFEFLVFKRARALGLPILGIGQGMLTLNTFFQGTLFERMDDLKSGKKVVHRYERDHRTIGCHHLVTLEDERALMTVNSYHEQGIKSLGMFLTPLARSHDGLIEVFESRRGPYVLAVQFHPEKAPQSEMFTYLEKFFDKVKENNLTRRNKLLAVFRIQ